tara:strand:- start:49 stop:867 length:819 start_codon:yes stop_codon:yes gene_type:complete
MSAIKNSIEKELSRLSEKFSGRCSADVRAEALDISFNGESYQYGMIHYPFGERKCFIKKSQEEYEDLQCTRNFWWQDKKSKDSVRRLKNNIEQGLQEANMLRVKELECLVHLSYSLPENYSVAEVGFRSPVILDYFLKNGSRKAIGYDVVDYNILLARELKYEVYKSDIGSDDTAMDLSDIDVVMCYQVLEHVTNPLAAVRRIYDSMKSGSFFHVEIPIEPDVPRIEWGHLYPFHNGDIEEILKIAGFTLRYSTDHVWKDGPEVRRVFCKKE